jgi:hypothetical protein
MWDKNISGFIAVFMVGKWERRGAVAVMNVTFLTDHNRKDHKG